MISDDIVTPSQIAAWYHRQILRIPHGVNQNHTKRYLDDDQVLELFDGVVVVQEKVDGKLSWENAGESLILYEDMTGKHTVHDHVMKYSDLPVDKKILLDMIRIRKDFVDLDRRFKILPVSPNNLEYAVLIMDKPNISHIYKIMEVLSRSPSHFGNHCIEGLVVKNYSKGLFCKWINEEFEDML